MLYGEETTIIKYSFIMRFGFGFEAFIPTA
jgi:hypothetical protein